MCVHVCDTSQHVVEQIDAHRCCDQMTFACCFLPLFRRPSVAIILCRCRSVCRGRRACVCVLGGVLAARWMLVSYPAIRPCSSSTYVRVSVTGCSGVLCVYMYVYVYIYVCVCVCGYVRVSSFWASCPSLATPPTHPPTGAVAFR